MPLLTHDETGAASVARARAVAVAEQPTTAARAGRPAKEPAGRPRSTWQRARRWLWLALVLLLVVPLIAFVIGWLIFKVPTADDTVLAQTATFAFADGSPVAVVRPQNGNRVKVTLDKVPRDVQNAVLAAEDRTFRSNPGFDIIGIARAVYSQLSGGVGGGSTITQQYVKNATGQDQATLWRKYKEVVISVKISKEQTKDQILENYLNTIYFGQSANGIQAAAKAYFNKDVGDLTVSEGAFLAGTIQSPSNKDPNRSRARWNYVLDQMVQAGWLTPVQRAAQVYPKPLPQAPAVGGVPDDDRYHIYDKAKAELVAHGITEDQINTQGLTVTTTVDPVRQRLAVDAVKATMGQQPENLRAALAAVDPRTGAIVAYFGGSKGLGTDYADGGIGRQPGSSFKPFVLAAALQANKGIGLGSLYDGTSGQTFPGLARPVVNADGDSCASCDVKTAMTKSINTIFYRMAVDIGPQNVIDAAHRAGIPDSQLTRAASGGIALGDQEVHPLDMASAYGTFAADGIHHDPYIVSKVVAADGRVLLDRTSTDTTAAAQRVSQEVACNVTESMLDVAGTSRIAPSGVPAVAAKTGTVQLDGSVSQNKDTWTVGYTPALSTAVWVGSDFSDPVKTRSGSAAYGRTLAGPIWQSFMSGALKGARSGDEQFSPCVPLGKALSRDSAFTPDGTQPGTLPSGSAVPTTDSNGNIILGTDAAGASSTTAGSPTSTSDSKKKKNKKSKTANASAPFIGPDGGVALAGPVGPG